MNILIVALIIVESGWNPKAVSHAGAVGLTQVTPIAALQVQQDNNLSLHTPNLFDKKVSIWYGTKYLEYCSVRTKNTRELLSCYNAGMRAVFMDRKGRNMPDETIRYVIKVTAYMSLLSMLERDYGKVQMDTRIRRAL